MSQNNRSKLDHLISFMQEKEYEHISYFNDHATGLRSIVAVHSTVRGPALGGTRLFPYESEKDALFDVTRLSRAMTYKASLAELSLGGGKAVIIGDPKKVKSPDFWRAYGRCIDRLNGSYITTVDSGSSPQDMNFVKETTNHVVGMTSDHGGHGDPSPSTALGVLRGIEASAAVAFGSKSLDGVSIAVQGVGHVGEPLVRLLAKAGAKLTIADINNEKVDELCNELACTKANPDEILFVDCDILAPCAMGAVISPTSLPKIKAKVIAGAANNQLSSKEVGQLILESGLHYAPDFAINAGGLIHVCQETSNMSAQELEQKVDNIYNTISDILTHSQENKKPSNVIAIEMAKERIKPVN